MKLVTRLKAAARMFFAQGHSWYILPSTRINYASIMGDGLKSSIVMACLMWIMRTLPEAPLGVAKDEEIDHSHELARLLRRPNPYFSGIELIMAVALSYAADGNAYLVKIRNAQLKPIELWYIPHWFIEPKYNQDGSTFIDYYEYNTGMHTIRLKTEDVVHFRFGIDPENIRKGLSQIKTLVREVYTDEEAANFTASMLRNGGIPGLLISPASEMMPALDDDIKDIKTFFKENFTGDKRGEPAVMRGPTKVEQFGFNPQQLDLGRLREIPEERVTACLGIPAAVVGFGTGLQQTKVGATMKEMRELAYESCIVPMQRAFGETLTMQLLNDFDDDEDAHVVADTSHVRILQEDENKRATRIISEMDSGAISVAEAREALGYDVLPEHEIYLRPFNKVAVPVGQLIVANTLPTLPVDAAQSGNDNGNGKRRFIIPPRKERTPQQVGFAQSLLADEIMLATLWTNELEADFLRLGLMARLAYEAWASLSGVELRCSNLPATKAKWDEVYDAIIAGGVKPADSLQYGPQYLRVAKQTYERINVSFGLGVNFTDQSEMLVLSHAGTRKGLVDMSEQMRHSIFETMERARLEGLGPMQAADLLEKLISAGPWPDALTRANVIARTETKYAQNISSLMAYKEGGVEMVEIFDAQADNPCEICQSINGSVVSLIEAESNPLEHPNCTRSYVPIVEGRTTGPMAEQVTVEV